MNGVDLIQAAIARRTASGLGLRLFGAKAEADGACERQYAKDGEQLTRWVEDAQRRGYEYEIIR